MHDGLGLVILGVAQSVNDQIMKYGPLLTTLVFGSASGGLHNRAWGADEGGKRLKRPKTCSIGGGDFAWALPLRS